jgi:hypothetical protein
MKARLLLAVGLLVTILVYWIGLHGPFLLDDSHNLKAVHDWLDGQMSWQYALLDNRSGMLGRPLSMGSFMLSAALSGFNPFSFKLGNLVIHLACGLVGWQVLRRALAQDTRLSPHADLTASLLVTIWLLHPINVSTVLYVIQRMAQMSTLFVLGSLWVYMAARRWLIVGKVRQGLAGLFLLFPLLVLAGLMGKENAAVAPALCLVLELAYFSGQPGPRRVVPAFFAVYLVLPAVVAVSALQYTRPGWLTNAYQLRDFTLWERLISEGRALMDYIGVLIFPRSPKLGIFTVDFVASTGLLSPPTTLICILALLAISGFAVVMRKRAPSLFAGWFFFLIAHSIESSFLPLELYFEHRNYLPAFGLWLGMAGLCELATRNLRTNLLSVRQLGLLVASGFILVFAFSTHGRARVWQSAPAMFAQALETHPNSIRAILANAGVGLNTGNMQMAYEAADRLLAHDNPRYKLLGRITRITYSCIDRTGASPEDLRQAVLLAQSKMTMFETHAFEVWEGLGPDADCGVVNPGMVADTIVSIANAATAQADTSVAKWRARLIAARLYGRVSRWGDALAQAKLAWQPNADAAVGGFLSRAYANNDMPDEADRIYAETKSRTNPNNSDDMAGLAELREFLDKRNSVHGTK